MNTIIEDIPNNNFLSAVKADINIRKNQWTSHLRENARFSVYRNQQYVLLAGLSGVFKLMLDFKEFELVAPFVLIIQPGQIYQVIAADEMEMYHIDFDPAVIPLSLNNLLYRYLMNKPVVHRKELLYRVSSISELMYQLSDEPGNMYHHQSLQALLHSLLNLLVACDLPPVLQVKKETRSILIEQEFQLLLRDKYKIWKKPCQYAIAMAISVSHLNDTVSEVTGHSVSDHIQQFVMLEAKRRLFCTNHIVKEIGYELGFEDPIYFNKLFKKVAGTTPMQFRYHFREEYANIKPGEGM